MQTSTQSTAKALNLGDYPALFFLSAEDKLKKIISFSSDSLAAHLQGQGYPAVACDTTDAQTLPFVYHQFDLMLSAGALWMESFDLDRSWQQLHEMLRVATEVRVAPLFATEEFQSFLGPFMLKLQTHGFGVEIRAIKLPALPGAVMLRVWSQQCQLS